MTRTIRAVVKGAGVALAVVLALLATAAGYFGVKALAREHPPTQPGTVHASLSRESCAECHAPIAAEWRESFHARTVTGPFWARIRTLGYADLFATLRVPCMNCHAPANVLDLAAGAPVQRSDGVDSGVDCVSCHVSARGIAGAGRAANGAHEVIGDARFRDPAVTSTTLCARCHDEGCEQMVTDWRPTAFARDGVTCLHCHMPEVTAPSVADGPSRRRRSHRFAADKDIEMLRRALNASLTVDGNGTAVVRIVNDRVGHALPGSGMNQLIVAVTARGSAGAVATAEASFGTKELIPGYLDFWPFREVTKIPPGESREIAVRLPPGPGEVAAEFRYRDWFAITGQDRLIDRIARAY